MTQSHPGSIQLLTDPFLLSPTPNSIKVIWFTEFPGFHNFVNYGENLTKIVTAQTTQLHKTFEDEKSRFGEQVEMGQIYQKPVKRNIWRHEALLTNLTPGLRIPYQVTSSLENGTNISSKIFSLASQPEPGQALKILLTSDHQLMPMTAANLQKVKENFGEIDGVFLVGDLVNIPDRASEWFDDNRGCAFFPCLQGKGSYQLEKNGVKTVYYGGEIIQYAPLFTALGNHEVMGRFSPDKGLNSQFNDAYPRLGKNQDQDQSFNTDTYQEIFGFTANQKYYAVTFGDIRLVVLYVTNMWRTPSLDSNARGRYREAESDFNHPENWGYGQHIFEPITPGSNQYNWLENELKSDEFKQAKYKIVMFHHPAHTLGDNIVPAYTDPVQIIERDGAGKITAIRYEYPKEKDYIIRDILPLLEAAKVQLVFNGHSHLWNRFVSAEGMHFLESSNVGNSYGAAWGEKARSIPSGYQEDYTAIGDPNGLEPITPTVAPLLDENGNKLPYIASNDLTVFSIFDTSNGSISSYYFDTKKPDSTIIKFDEFRLYSKRPCDDL